MRFAACLALSAAAFVSAAPATGAEDPGAAVRGCHAETDDARRLACYDRVTRRAGGDAPGAAAAAAPVAAPAPAAAARSADDFGRERQLAHEEDRKRAEATRAIGELRASIVGIQTRMDGLMTFTLDNGQVWRQTRPDSRFAIKQGDAVLIQPGSLGSFILSGPTKKSTRVTRVQ
jgi:hypothetical protein